MILATAMTRSINEFTISKRIRLTPTWLCTPHTLVTCDGAVLRSPAPARSRRGRGIWCQIKSNGEGRQEAWRSVVCERSCGRERRAKAERCAHCLPFSNKRTSINSETGTVATLLIADLLSEFTHLLALMITGLQGQDPLSLFPSWIPGGGMQ